MRGLVESALILSVVAVMGVLAGARLPQWLCRPFPPTPDEQYLWAIEAKDVARSREVCRKLARDHYRTADGWSMLSLAAYHGSIADMQAAIDAGEDVNDAEGTITPLRAAVLGGNEQIVEFLLRKQADVDAEAPEGKTPLSAAVNTGQVRIVALLLEHGAGTTCHKHLDDALADALDHGNPQTIAMLQAAITRQQTW